MLGAMLLGTYWSATQLLLAAPGDSSAPNTPLLRTTAIRRVVSPVGNNPLCGYVASIAVGTPAQQLDLLMDTGSANLFFGTTGCRDPKLGPCSPPLFDVGASRTFNSSGDKFDMFGWCEGQLGADTVAVAPGSAIRGQRFGLCRQSSILQPPSGPAHEGKASSWYGGIFGLGMRALEQQSSQIIPPLTLMKQQGLIDRELFAVALDSNGSDSGEIQWGFVDETKYRGNLTWHPMAAEGEDSPDGHAGEYVYYKVNVDALHLGKTTIVQRISASDNGVRDYSSTATGSSPQLQIMTDTGAVGIYPPNNAILTMLHKLAPVKPDCSNRDTLPDLKITIGSVAYTIPSSLYVLSAAVIGGSSSQCISAFMEGGDDFWLMGDPWFRAVYSVMDVEGHRYGMAANIHAPSGQAPVVGPVPRPGAPSHELSAESQCQEPGWRPIEVVETHEGVINTTNLPLEASFFGIEGGHMIQVNDTLYTVITEFTKPPIWVPSNIALWKADAPKDSGWPQNWRRARTLFVSDGTTTGTDCNSTRASLGSSAALAYDDKTELWNIFYVGFISCNDSAFVNRQGRIFRAVSETPGHAGIESSYRDVDVVLKPDDGHSQRWWEGTQGDDSMQPFYLGPKRGWAAFFGSAGVLDSGINIGQRMGLATAPELGGPWVRATGRTNPVNMSLFDTNIEQPIVTRLKDGRGFVAFFDALQAQARGMIGYSFSRDGLTVSYTPSYSARLIQARINVLPRRCWGSTLQWKPECSQLLHVVTKGKEGNIKWNTTGMARTPQGAVELDNGGLLLGFSAYDFDLPPHYHLVRPHAYMRIQWMPWWQGPCVCGESLVLLQPSWPGGNQHESMGVAKLQFANE